MGATFAERASGIRSDYRELAAFLAEHYNVRVSNRSAFQRGVDPLLKLLLSGKEEAVLTIAPDKALGERIEFLAAKSNEGELTDEEREEYAGYVQANKFIAVLRREARAMQAAALS